MIDVHCHLTAREFEGNVGLVISSAIESGIKAMITSGLGYQDCLKALRISDNRVVYPSLGVPPYDLDDYEKVAGLIERERDRIVAIGEVGLDYWRAGRGDRYRQQRIFREFIELAKALDLPLVVHSRSAGRCAIDILLEMRVERVVMHAFDGRASYAAEAAEGGFMFSIPPSIARSPQKQKLVNRIPLENLLLESDAPALPPIPGEINHPRNVRVSAEWISRLKHLSFEKVAEATTSNALAMFDLHIPP